jgi:hypothetical protein
MTARTDAERRTVIAFLTRFFGGLHLRLPRSFIYPQFDICLQLFTGLKRQKQNVDAENKTKDFHRNFQIYF